MPRCAKRRFRDEISAKLALAVIARKDRPTRRECRVYRCPLCAGWHTASRP